MSGSASSDLDAALAEFEKVDANLQKLERQWARISGVPQPDRAEYDDAVAAFGAVLPYLPPIDGMVVTAIPMTFDEVASLRFDAWEVDEPEAHVSTEAAIEQPGDEVRAYRRAFDAARKSVARNRVIEVVSDLDLHLLETDRRYRDDGAISPADWETLGHSFAELDRLVGATMQRRGRWSDMSRHLYFAHNGDFEDIVNHDWPSVKSNVQDNLYDDDEPIPVAMTDLGSLARSRPTGPVSTTLHWDRLTDSDFERLIFELLRTTEGYVNVNLMMNTHAPDKGRDVHAEKVSTDPLSGTLNQRVIVQCKHWLSKSVGRDDAFLALETAKLWEPPPLDVFIIATTGRFAQGAVEWADKRNQQRETPHVHLWPESHLEGLLAQRPALVAEFGLR